MDERGNLADAKDHPILAQPYSYFVAGVTAEFDPTSQLDNSIVLVLVRDETTVSLRFGGVHGLEIDDRFPYGGPGPRIFDISHLKWDGTRIRVTDLDPPSPGIRFWARSVELLPNAST